MDFFGNTTPGSQMPMQNETYQPTENAAVQEEKAAEKSFCNLGGRWRDLQVKAADCRCQRAGSEI